MARTRTTVSVERATLRLAGLSGADPASFSAGEGAGTQPWVNTVVDAVREQVGLQHGVALPVWHALGSGEYADLHELAAKTAAGSVRYALPEGKDADRAGRAARRAVASGLSQVDRRRKARDRLVKKYGEPPQPWIYPHRRHRRHPRGHPAGAGRRARGRRRGGGDPVHRSVAARLRARGRHPHRLRRHVRDAGELPAHAGRPRRRLGRGRPLRAAHQLRVRTLHARDRRAGRAGAAGHDAQRLHVRDHLPGHQPTADVHRPAVLPDGARARRHRHQHRRGQLPHHRRRGRRRAHGGRLAAAQRAVRPRGRAGRRAARARPRLRDQPGAAGVAAGWSWRMRSWSGSCSRTRR